MSDGQRPMRTLLGGGKVADILLWKDKYLSGGILAGGTVTWVVFELAEYPVLPFLCYILMFLMIILFTWSKSAGLVKRNPPTFNDIWLSESALKFFFDQINQILLAFYDVSTGRKGLKPFFVTLAWLFVLSFVGSLFSIMTFSYIVFACVATIPAWYERNEQQVDEIVGRSYQEINSVFKDFSNKFLDKIPRGIKEN